MNACVATEAKDRKESRGKSPRLPCGINEQTQAVIPCTEKEEGAMKAALKSTKGLCPDEEGIPGPCPGDLEKTKATMKKQGMAMDCTDAQGRPIECPPPK